MRLTQFTDYALRVLVYAASRESKRASVAEVAAAFHVSHNHLVKVVHRLGQLGYLQTIRGKGGGFALARPAETIVVGEVIRGTEPDFKLAECFEEANASCPIVGAPCKLASALAGARRAFLEHLDQFTLADVSRNRNALVQLLRAAGD